MQISGTRTMLGTEEIFDGTQKTFMYLYIFTYLASNSILTSHKKSFKQYEVKYF